MYRFRFDRHLPSLSPALVGGLEHTARFFFEATIVMPCNPKKQFPCCHAYMPAVEPPARSKHPIVSHGCSRKSLSVARKKTSNSSWQYVAGPSLRGSEAAAAVSERGRRHPRPLPGRGRAGSGRSAGKTPFRLGGAGTESSLTPIRTMRA